MNKLLILAMCAVMSGCGIVIVDSISEGKGGGTGGEGGSAGSETTSSDSGGTGGGETTSSTETVTETSTETETTTETEVCDPGPKDCQEDTCFCPSDHVCCDKAENPDMCVGNINGYCCPLDMFCIPKG